MLLTTSTTIIKNNNITHYSRKTKENKKKKDFCFHTLRLLKRVYLMMNDYSFVCSLCVCVVVSLCLYKSASWSFLILTSSSKHQAWICTHFYVHRTVCTLSVLSLVCSTQFSTKTMYVWLKLFSNIRNYGYHFWYGHHQDNMV